MANAVVHQVGSETISSRINDSQTNGGIWWLSVAVFLILAALALSDDFNYPDCRQSTDLASVLLPILKHFTWEHLIRNILALLVVSLWGISCGVKQSDALAWASTIIVLNLLQALHVGMLCVYGMSGAMFSGVAIASLRLLTEPNCVAKSFSMGRRVRGLSIFLRSIGAFVIVGEFLFLLRTSIQFSQEGSEKLHGHESVVVDLTTHWMGFLLGCAFAVLGYFLSKGSLPKRSNG